MFVVVVVVVGGGGGVCVYVHACMHACVCSHLFSFVLKAYKTAPTRWQPEPYSY